MPRHFYSYVVIFQDGDFIHGIFSTAVDIFEGDTEENTRLAISLVCEHYDCITPDPVRYGVRPLSQSIIKEICDSASDLSGPGDIGIEP